MERASAVRVAVVLLLMLMLRETESQSNIDMREPILRRSPGMLNETHFNTHGDDLFGFAFAFHEIEEIMPGDGVEVAASKTR